MLARWNPVVRAIRLGVVRRMFRPAARDLLYVDGVFGRVLQVQRAVGVAALIGAAGWVWLKG